MIDDKTAALWHKQGCNCQHCELVGASITLYEPDRPDGTYSTHVMRGDTSIPVHALGMSVAYSEVGDPKTWGDGIVAEMRRQMNDRAQLRAEMTAHYGFDPLNPPEDKALDIMAETRKMLG